MSGVLEGLTVLDLSWGIAGPIASMLLADNGADVTRIERPAGDPFAGSSGYVVWHRGKRHKVLDLRERSQHDEFLALAATADVLVESFSPGTAARLGIDHATLAAANPRLISCSITGYGRDSRHSTRPGYDALVAARTGLFFDQKGRQGAAMEYINGRPGPHPEFGAPEGMVRGADRPGPIFPRSTWPSLGASLLAALGIAAALRVREVTGRGQWVETSLLQGALASTCLNWQRVENPDAPTYWMWPIDSRSIEGLFECADGRWVHHWTVRPNWVFTVSAGEKLAIPDLDHRYRDDPDRIGMEASDLLVGHFLYPQLAEAFRKFGSDEWVEVGERSEMGVAKVRTPAEALADESFLADGCVVEVDHAAHGRIRHVGNVLEFGAAVEGTSPAGKNQTALEAPLAGLRVLDLGLGVAGPFGPKMLADLGADVIKVHALHDTFWTGTHMGLGTNRGKRSIALNLKDPRGIELLHRLIDTADVVTTNWRPGAAARLGIDYDSLKARRPDLVFCNTRGYEKGPRSDLPGTDQTANALCGTEWEDGACDAGNAPIWSRSSMGDTGNALLAAIAMTFALYDRERTGAGRAVSTSIVNAALLATSYAWIHADGTPGGWLHVDGDQHGLGDRYRIYECADGWICVAAITSDQAAALATALPVAERTTSEAFAALEAAGVPVEIVNEAFCREMFDDPELRDRHWISQTSAGGVGRFEDPGLLIDFSETPGVIRRGPCLCGEHSRAILRELGLDDAEIDALAEARVIGDNPVA